MLSLIGCLLAGVAVVIALASLVWNYRDSRYWREQKKIWKNQNRPQKVDLVKTEKWCKQHNDGPNPCGREYPDVTFRDFSGGMVLFVDSEERI